jgi:hypothetical protein
VSSPDRFLSTIVRWPPTWLAVLAACALEAAFIATFRPSLGMLGASLGLGLALLALWPLVAVRSPAFLERHYALHQASSEDRHGLQALEADLVRLEAEQGLDQLRMIRQKLESLTDVLRRRLDAGELTYGRYLGTAQQVYLATLDNLGEIVVILTSVGAIDRDYIIRRSAELGEAEDASPERRREIESLAERHGLLERQLGKIASLYAQNEAAMTALDNTAMALAETRTSKGQASVDAEAAMAALENLAKRADKYAATT